jgi:hypothetical protein
MPITNGRPAARHSRVLSMLAALTLVCLTSGAQVMSAQTSASAPSSGVELLQRMHDRYAKSWYHSLSFTQSTEVHLPNDSVVHQTWWETASGPGYLRIRRLANDDRNVSIYRKDSLYTRRNGGPWQGRKLRNDLLVLGFDVYRQPVDTSAQILREEGYDLGVVSEGTWDGRPVWIVGAKSGDVTTPQFWIDKERLVYVHSIMRGIRDTTKTATVTFGDYAPLAGGWISRDVSIEEGGKLLQREVYRDIKANVDAPLAIFDPAQIP